MKDIMETGKGLDLRKLLMAVAMTALVMSKAYGAEPKTESTVTGDTVTVGDVFRDAGDDAGRYLAPAPASGAVLALNAGDLTRISDAFHLGWQSQTQGEHVVIRRETSDVDHYAIEAALQESLAAQLSGRKFDMEMQDPAVALRLPGGTDRTVQVDNVKLDLQKGRFSAVVSAPAGAATPAARKEVQGRIYTLAEVPVLKSPLRPGDIIGAQDLDYIDMRSGDVAASTITDAAKLVGQTPRRGIAGMKPVTAGDIEAPAMVKKGDLVTVVLKSGTLSLTVQGRALQTGAEGESVRIVNTASNRMMEGVVTGMQTVAVQAPSSML